MIEELKKHKLAAVLRSESADKCIEDAKNAFSGGIRILEVTFSVPDAADAISTLREILPDAIVGCGSVQTKEQLEQAKNSGAHFAVSPHLDGNLMELSKTINLFYVPGCFTPTEVAQAIRLNAEMIKVFPASWIGPNGLKALRAPFSNIPPLMATGGVTKENMTEWFQAGADVICAGSNLFSTDDTKAEAVDWVQRL